MSRAQPTDAAPGGGRLAAATRAALGTRIESGFSRQSKVSFCANAPAVTWPLEAGDENDHCQHFRVCLFISRLLATDAD